MSVRCVLRKLQPVSAGCQVEVQNNVFDLYGMSAFGRKSLGSFFGFLFASGIILRSLFERLAPTSYPGGREGICSKCRLDSRVASPLRILTFDLEQIFGKDATSLEKTSQITAF